MAIEGIGRLYNIIPTADGVAVDMREGDAVDFVCVGADTYTISYGATSAAATNPGDIIDHYYENAGALGATAWVETAVSPASEAVVVAANGIITVHGAMLPDTGRFVKCTSTGAGLVYAILHDLVVQRAPDNMPVMAT